MLDNFDYYRTTKYSKLKERTRKGIPDGMRGIAWINIANIKELKKVMKTYTKVCYKI